MAHEPADEWDVMMKKVAAFHAKHDFAGQNGHDMGYRLSLIHISEPTRQHWISYAVFCL